VLQQLLYLTHLERGNVDPVGPDDASPALQPLQALTRLVDLHLEALGQVITSSMLSGMLHLTSLRLMGMKLEPGALAGKTGLQSLRLRGFQTVGGAAGVSQLLSHLQPMQQLTDLSLSPGLFAVGEGSPPVAAYAALTASSKLQHLYLSSCTLPAGVWQHLFPTGRQLPHLQSLNIGCIIGAVRQPSGNHAAAPEGSRIVSCCPGLQDLDMWCLPNPELTLVHGLSTLQSLRFSCDGSAAECVQAVCHLTGLRSLIMLGCCIQPYKEGMLLGWTQLRQLTHLVCNPFEVTHRGTNNELYWKGEPEYVASALLPA
jgi:hypothetical protein